MPTVYFDTETCGFTGPVILIQYAIDGGPVEVHNVFKNPANHTLNLIDKILCNRVVAFNLVYDWFHIVKTYNILSRIDGEVTPERYRTIEREFPRDFVLLPQYPCDVFLWAKKTKFNHLMERDPIVIRRVPSAIAYKVLSKINEHLQLPDIYFSFGGGWKIKEHDESAFCDLVLTFAPSLGLDALSKHILGEGKSSYIPENIFLKDEPMYDPINGRWKEKIVDALNYWDSPLGLRYARTDVERTRQLHEKIPCEFADVDSELSCMIANYRWQGIETDRDRLLQHRDSDLKIIEGFETFYSIPATRSNKLMYKLRGFDNKITSSDKHTLRKLAEKNNALGIFCKDVIKARSAKKRLDIINPLLETERYHPDFKIYGTKTGRMSGAGRGRGNKSPSVNPHGIPPKLRDCFFFSEGGDFTSFEMFIQDGVYKDENLHKLLTSGRKLYGVVGAIFTRKTYDEVMEQFYAEAKQGTLALSYQAEKQKLAQVFGISVNQSMNALREMRDQFPVMVAAWEETRKRLSFVSQEDGIGTQIFWKEPETTSYDLFGNPRSYEAEIGIARALFQVAKDRDFFSKFTEKIYRRQREQTYGGAAMSAIYASVFGIQSAIVRQGINHPIQGTGARITKEVQREIGRSQGYGIQRCKVITFNYHDELEVKSDSPVRHIINSKIEEFRNMVPLLTMDWKDIERWSDVK